MKEYLALGCHIREVRQDLRGWDGTAGSTIATTSALTMSRNAARVTYYTSVRFLANIRAIQDSSFDGNRVRFLHPRGIII